MEVNERIKQYLKNKGIKQSFLTEKTGIDKVTISFMLNSKRKISANELGVIAEALGVSADIFLH